MKRPILLFITLIFSILTTFAQRTPQQMAAVLQQMDERLDKYDYEVQLDSFYYECQRQIRLCDKKIAKGTPAAYAERAVWRALLAKVEYDYYNLYGWRIRNRSAGANDEEQDWHTWDEERLKNDIIQNYQLALQDARPSQADSKPYASIFQFNNTPLQATLAYPTLYDLIAVEFNEFLSYKSYRALPEHILSDDFPTLTLDTSDSLALDYRLQKLYQEMIRYHENDADKTALIVWKLRIFNSSLGVTHSVRENYLQRLEEHFGQEKFAWLIFLKMGDFYADEDHLPSHNHTNIHKVVHYYQWVQEATATSYPNIAKKMREALDRIQKPAAQVTPSSSVLLPKNNLVSITSRNCDSVFVYIKPYDYHEFENRKFSVQNVLHKFIVPVSTQHQYLDDTTLLSIPPLPYGDYTLLASPLPLTSPSLKNVNYDWTRVLVSSLAYLHQYVNSQFSVVVMDLDNGQPIADAKVSLVKDNKVVSSVLTDAEGKGKANTNTRISYFEISKGKDKTDREYSFRRYYESDDTSFKVECFLDRAIYRPGQIVHWKGIVVTEHHCAAEIMPNEEVEVILEDGNSQKIQSVTVTTNEFGSIAGEFQLPKSGFLGNYHIWFKVRDNHCGNHTFKVEEYKRPTFEVVMEPPAESFRTGEQVTVHGKATAYAGYPVQDATVSYRITRDLSFPFRSGRWWLNPYLSQNRNAKTIASDICATDEEGNFQISFLAENEDSYRSYCPILNFTVEVTVTDKSGETHTQKLQVNVCDRAIRFETSIPEVVNTDLGVPSFPVQAVNMNGKPQTAIVNYRLVRVEMPKRFLEKAPFITSQMSDKLTSQFPDYAFYGEEIPGNWKETAVVSRGTLNLPNDSLLVLPELQQQPGGAYKVILSTTDTFGSIVEEEYVFYTTRNNSDTFTVFKALNVHSSRPTAEVGETIHFTIGSYLDNAHVLVRVFNNDQLIEEKWVHLHQSSTTLSYKVQPGQQGLYTCQAYTYHNGKCYTTSEVIRIPFSNKSMNIEFVTFRDKLQPGETATVKLRLKDEFHQPLRQAELLCAMYDASLDIFRPNSYSLKLNNTKGTIPTEMKKMSDNRPYQSPLYYSYSTYFSLPIFTWKYQPHWCSRHDSGDVVLEQVCEEPILRADNALNYDLALESDNDHGVGFGSGAGAGAPKPTPEHNTPAVEPPRKNFAETALFLPFLRTNDNGEIEMEFTLPESLTRWKMLGVSHTQDLRTGTFEKLLVAQKPVMVAPNAPRFLYEGDRLTLSSKVVNTSDQALAGQMVVQLIDPVSGATVAVNSQFLSVAANSTSTVDFTADIPMELSALTYRVTGRFHDGNITYSDGEEKTLPVLSRRQLVTETVPFFITRQGRKTFSLERLRQNSKSLVSCKMQFTPTPRWNVVLALPYLTQYPYDCHEQLFSKLYANSLSAYILRTHPNLKALLNDCRENHPEALDSKLRQNEELMQVLLAETPWKMDAQQEEQDIQDIFCLFDEERTRQESAQMVRKIEAGQNSDGGWPWFAGGKSSPYITEHLLIGTGRLVKQGICQYGNAFLKKSAIQKAITFIDNEIEKDYQYQKKHGPKFLTEYTLGSDILHYLYARSFYPETGNNRESYRFYKQHLLKEAATLPTFYQKTMAALTLYQWGTSESKALAKSIMLDIKKKAQQSEEMGMFWKKEGWGYYWDDAPIERQALMMEAFQTILGDQETVKQMEIWLLQQRHGSHWSTTRATADACYAVFCTSGETNDGTPASITLKICGETRNYADTLQIPVKEDVAGCLTNPDAGDIVLTTTRDGLSYGGVFYQYYADIDSIVSTGTDIPLSVERQLYRVESGDKGEVLTPITDERPLRVGDKVRVRLVIRCDRDLEYVHLKDLRAAAFEPADGTVSGYRWQDGLSYYQSFRDASVNFFFEKIRQGTYVFEYSLWVNQFGKFSSGYASIQCMYAPEFCAHSSASGTLEILR